MIPSDVFSIVTVIIFTSLKKEGSYFVDIINDRNQHQKSLDQCQFCYFSRVVFYDVFLALIYIASDAYLIYFYLSQVNLKQLVSPST